VSEDGQDVTDEATADEPVAEVEVDAVGETASEVADDPVAEEPAAEEPVEEPVAEEDSRDEPVVEEAQADQPVAEEAQADEPVVEESATVDEAFGPVRVARVFVCERGHRTTTLWGEPDICQARPFRNGAECGLALYHITELPEQVQKALNPLKASKKASKKK
jgi:hypothetical protein